MGTLTRDVINGMLAEHINKRDQIRFDWNKMPVDSARARLREVEADIQTLYRMRDEVQL